MHTVDYILHIILKEKNYVCGGHDGTFLLGENEIVPRNTKRKKKMDERHQKCSDTHEFVV
jgi:hypothetical protein